MSTTVKHAINFNLQLAFNSYKAIKSTNEVRLCLLG